jgi:tetratricopeptide (TPR) repeat protein
MPTTTYMLVDPRHDHSMRIPRPDLSVRLGTPNACNNCHTDKKSDWAAAQVQKWYGHAPGGYQRFAETFAASANGTAGTDRRLREVAADLQQPAIARATALARLAGDRDPATLNLLRQSLNHSDETIRLAAAGALAQAEPAQRLQALPPLLTDPVRSVRMEAARALAGEPEQKLSAVDREAFAKALAEYVQAQRFNADRPEAQSNLGMLHAERGDIPGAEKALREALALDASFAPAAVNLADLYRSHGRDADAEKTLRAALANAPREATLHHSLGLTLARQKRTADAVAELGRAVQLAPDSARYVYVYAVALHSAGKVPQAIAELERAQRRFPGNQAVLEGLVAFERDRGNRAAAIGWATQLVALDPDNPQARRLLEALQR